MKRLTLILALFMPTFATAEYWSTLTKENKKFVFDIVRKGKKISEWSTKNGLYILIDFEREFYVCMVRPSTYVNEDTMEISCRDANR